MATTPVTGTGPFEFTDAQGRHISIPLSAFSFDSTNKLTVNSDWAAETGAAPGSALLAYAVKEKLITPAAAPATIAAMVVKAVDQGATGNNIKVQVVKGTSDPDPTKTTFNIVLDEVDTYPKLTAATVESILGSVDSAGATKVAGSNPGLVRVLSGSVDTTGVPVAATGSLSGDPAEADVDGSGSPARVFTLVAKKAGPDGANIQFEITPEVSSPQIGPETFKLVASWHGEVDNVTLTSLQSSVQSVLGYEITITTPASGAFSVPGASTTTLSGGGTGVSASGTIFTGV